MRLGSIKRASILALFDQAIVSLGNFGTNLTIARHVSPAVYGQFVLIWSLLLFLNNLHSSLIVYPFTVRRAGEGGLERSRWVRPALLFTGCFLLIELPLLTLALQIFGLRPLLLPVYGCLLAWQVQEICRRSLLAALAFDAAAWGDFLAYPGQVVAVLLLMSTQHLTLANIFWVMMATSTMAGLLQFVQQYRGWNRLALREAAPVFWSLGRWGFANNWLGLITGPVLIWVLSASHGTASAGYLQALIAVLGVTHPILFGIGNAIVPSVAAAQVKGGEQAAWREARTFAWHGACLFAPYLLLLSGAPREGLRLFYGAGSPYLPLSVLVRLMCLNYSFMFVSQIFDGLANGLQRPRINFSAQAVAAALAASVALPAAIFFDVSGAVAGLCVLNSARMLTQWKLLQRSAEAGQLG